MNPETTPTLTVKPVNAFTAGLELAGLDRAAGKHGGKVARALIQALSEVADQRDETATTAHSIIINAAAYYAESAEPEGAAK